MSTIDFISNADKNLVLNGSARTHLLTYFIAKQIVERTKRPCTIIHIDQHSDGISTEFNMDETNSNVSRHNFYQRLMSDSEFVKANIFIKNTDMLDTKEPYSKITNSGVIHSINEKGILTFLPNHVYYDASELADRVLRRIRTNDIYITLDGDIVNPDYIKTDCGNGTMSLSFIKETLKGFKDNRRLLGADICGLKRNGADIKSLETYTSICSTLLELLE